MAEYPADQFDGVPKSDVMQIVELEVKVADLEAANERMAAALRTVQEEVWPLIDPVDDGYAATGEDWRAAGKKLGRLFKDGRLAALSDEGLEVRARFNFWKAMRIWDEGKDWEKQGCRCCIAMWKPGEPAQHAEDCCFHPAPAERPWR